ncbi:MAG: hemerythrin domain-containing protein [Chlorobiota bacterium]|jgi:hemerythrin-like domain-containing protein|nr:hemerythrin domain-containing protein [Chlorobiota bacterium]QQS66193.1 MAG: hemerythrin domain-containing protein [Chlorobiota bacterium]
MQNSKQLELLNPAQSLINEHVIFMESLNKLSEALKFLDQECNDLPDSILQIAESTYFDMNEHLNIHFIKEEEIFFPLIEHIFPSGRAKFQFLHIDHDKLRLTFEQFSNLLQDIRSFGADNKLIIKLKDVSTEMIRLFYYHIVAEDTVYLEVAREKLPSDIAELAIKQMNELESRIREIN